MTQRLLGALQFLTLLPVSGGDVALSRCAVFFPLTGALLGAAAGAVYWGAVHIATAPFAALLTIAFLIVVTGGLHEDGLADVADAFRAGRSHEKILSILKDSRIGTFGGLALILSVLFRWQALAASRGNVLLGLVAALALSRTALVTLAAIAPAAGDGLGAAFVRDLSRRAAAAAAIQAIAIALLCGWRRGAAMIVVSPAIVLLARVYFVRRLGGVNGDCLGATCQAVEAANLLLLIWQPSS